MRIAFVHFTGLRPTASWSETAVSMVRGLRACGHEVTVLEPQVTRNTLLILARKAMYRMVGQHFHADRQRSVALELARSTEEQLALLPVKPDLVLSSSSLPIAFLRTDLPTAFWTDATFASMLGFYQEFRALSAETIRSGFEVENQALANCTYAFYSSEWAMRSAIKDHQADPSKVHVVPFGPNLIDIPDTSTVQQQIAARGTAPCRMIFIGYDWERKQGDLAMAVRKELEALGIATELSLVGAGPTNGSTSSQVKALGRLSKGDRAQRELLFSTLANAHFLVVPSKAECYGMVFAEAAAYGVPSVALDVGGVATVVRHGHNGLLFHKDDSARNMAERIAALWNSPNGYRDLAMNSRNDFEERLQWSSCIAHMERVIMHDADVFAR
ncbi:MAG: glycosyltransferase family 4 protein [Flavobacteriales bacterium]|nr:glycosyltransferase family 4 protein [Flavobacteriales bacterium]